MVSQGVAPSDKEASLSSVGMLRKISMRMFNIKGMIMMESTIAPASMVYPDDSTPKAGAIYLEIKGTTMITPQAPYTTEGIPARISITGCIILRKEFFAYWVRKIAVNKHIGAEMRIATKLTHSEPIINGRKPNFPFNGNHSLVKSNSPSECSLNIGIDLMYKPNVITKGIIKMITRVITIQITFALLLT